MADNGYLAGSNLEKVLRAGHFAVTGELGPPQSADAEVIRKKAALLRGYCDAVNITDNQTGMVGMSRIGAGTIVVQEGLEPVVQMTCRDRNRLAIQSDLLGAYALGMRNLLCLTGDHHSFGGAAANPFGDPFEFRPYRLAKKVKAGADFIQTQLIYNLERFKQFMEKVRQLGLHEKTYILAGVGPLKSPGMAKYMRDQVPGLDVPNEFVDRMTAAPAGIDEADKKGRAAAWRQEGIKVAIELIQQLREIEGVSGVHIMAIEWEAAVKPIVDGAGLLPRPVPEPLPAAGAGG